MVDDHDTSGVFEAALRGELVVRTCHDCGATLHLPRQLCRDCGSERTGWQVVSGQAHVTSWTVVEHQVHPDFPTPYTVLLVELDDHEDVRFVGHLPGRPVIRAGAPVRVRFERLDDITALPQWELVEP